jgi:hypothetical protein
MSIITRHVKVIAEFSFFQYLQGIMTCEMAICGFFLAQWKWE